jgi:hypothetical protein
MIKAAAPTISLLLLLATGPSVFAQPSTADVATAEAIHRQANIIELRRTLDGAAVLTREGDLPGAALQYERALDLVRDIGIGVERETKDAIIGLSAVRLQLAEQARRNANYAEADAQVSRVLKVDPRNVAAQKLKREIDVAQAERRGKVPSQEILDRIPAGREDAIATSTLVQDGRMLIEMG